MTTGKIHHYETRIAGSDFTPLPLVLKDLQTRLHLDLTGASVTITIVDETTGETIVKDGAAEPNADNPFLIEYYPTAPQVAKITASSTWIVQWTVIAGNGDKHIVPQLCRVPVRPPLL